MGAPITYICSEELVMDYSEAGTSCPVSSSEGSHDSELEVALGAFVFCG